MKNIGIKFFDGAFGTYYYAISGDDGCCELANIYNRDMVLKIHKEYIAAGADAIKTNTFAANSLLCLDHESLEDIIKSGYEIAKQAVAGTDVKVFADIGGISSDDELDIKDEYIKTAEIFLRLGATNFLFETLSDFENARPAIEFIKKKSKNSVIIVSFAVSQDGYSKTGHHYKKLLEVAASNKNVDAVGLNCVCGPSHMLNLFKDIDIKQKPTVAMPNSGYPSTLNGRTVFRDNAEYFSDKLVELSDIGIDIIGGCCGSTPLHIKLGIQKIKNQGRIIPKTSALSKAPENGIKSEVKRELCKSDSKIIAVEMDAPTDCSCDFLLDAVDQYAKLRVDIITVSDSPLSRTRADSIITAAKIKREKGIDVLPHMTCRDKNHIGLKASLLGAAFDGINKVLVITGDPIIQGAAKKSAGVFSFNSFELISYISTLNEEVFKDSPFLIGGALNVNATHFEKELSRAETKIKNGASFLLSQPIFTDQAIENFILAKKSLGCKILAGILPVASYKNAIFLNNEVAGIDISEDIVDSLRDKSKEQVYDISVAYSKKIIDRIYDVCDGLYLMTPLKKVDLVCRLIKEINEVYGR